MCNRWNDALLFVAMRIEQSFVKTYEVPGVVVSLFSSHSLIVRYCMVLDLDKNKFHYVSAVTG